ncbi:glucose PTS transporter subunit IIA [Enterococcus sp. AZ163]|uniref:PTS beta-glucoside transporter subunit IIBCA n=1 Tax=Enterococcus sp. AZ163 TaxID=2774638 RepID=UPI003D285DCB
MNQSKDIAVANAIIEAIGGKENIRAVGHCSSRLRLTLNDKAKVDEATIETIDGVKGQFFAGEQYQIILGTGFVDRVYNIVVGSSSDELNTDIKGDLYEGMSLPKKVSRILGDIFIPVIPVLVATGLFSGFINCINAFGVEMNPNVLTIATILMKTAFTFLPVLIAWAGMKQFGGSPVLGIVLGLMLVNPLLPNPSDVAKGVADAITFSFFGIDLNVVGYQGSVLPALMVAIIAAKTEKFLKKRVPDVLDLIVTPFTTILVAGLLGLIIIGPICQYIELLVLGAAKAVIGLPFGLGGLIIGGTQQAIVVTGMHHIFLALETDLLANTGFNPFNAMITGGIIAQATVALVTGWKVRDKKKRGFLMSASLPAFLGITEPAIFGVNLKFGKPFLFALTGGAAAGWIAGLLHAKSTGMGVAAIPGLVTYLYSATGIRDYFIIHLTGMLVAGGLVYFFFDPNEAMEQEEQKRKTEKSEKIEKIYNPVQGNVTSITEVNDAVFAKKMMGEGFAIKPENGEVYSPLDGTISSIFPTKHAVIVKAENGEEALIHMGIDTVELQGEGYEILVEEGQKVNKDTLLAKIDLSILEKNNKDNSIIVVFPEMDAARLKVDYGPQMNGNEIGSIV